jgi:penicillin-binding protein-related factor A (putative recombinase)
MKESQFASEILPCLKNNGAWVYKISDQPTSWTASRTRFTPEKPCDIVGMYKRKGFAIENKQIKKFEAFGLNKMRPSQIKNLDEIVEKDAGGAYVFLNIRIRSPQENRLIIFDWRELAPRLRVSSIKKQELMDMPYIAGKTILKNEFSKDRVVVYEIKPFLEGL